MSCYAFPYTFLTFLVLQSWNSYSFCIKQVIVLLRNYSVPFPLPLLSIEISMHFRSVQLSDGMRECLPVRMIRAIQSLWVQSEVDRQNACEMPLQWNEGKSDVGGEGVSSVFRVELCLGLAYKFRNWACVGVRRSSARWLIAVIRLVSSRPARAVVFACLRVQLEPTNCEAKTVIAYKYRTSCEAPSQFRLPVHASAARLLNALPWARIEM